MSEDTLMVTLHDSGEMSFGDSFVVTPMGLTAVGQPTYEQWVKVGESLRRLERAIQFCVGDWLNIGEERFKELADQVIDHEHWAENTVKVYRWVAKSVPPENRRSDLSFYHHQIVAGLPAAEQKDWLDKAAPQEEGADGWSTGRLQQEMKASKVDQKVEYLCTVGFDSPAPRDILAEEYIKVGRPVRRHERNAKEAEI